MATVTRTGIGGGWRKACGFNDRRSGRLLEMFEVEPLKSGGGWLFQKVNLVGRGQ